MLGHGRLKVCMCVCVCFCFVHMCFVFMGEVEDNKRDEWIRGDTSMIVHAVLVPLYVVGHLFSTDFHFLRPNNCSQTVASLLPQNNNKHIKDTQAGTQINH